MVVREGDDRPPQTRGDPRQPEPAAEIQDRSPFQRLPPCQPPGDRARRRPDLSPVGNPQRRIGLVAPVLEKGRRILRAFDPDDGKGRAERNASRGRRGPGPRLRAARSRSRASGRRRSRSPRGRRRIGAPPGWISPACRATGKRRCRPAGSPKAVRPSFQPSRPEATGSRPEDPRRPHPHRRPRDRRPPAIRPPSGAAPTSTLTWCQRRPRTSCWEPRTLTRVPSSRVDPPIVMFPVAEESDDVGGSARHGCRSLDRAAAWPPCGRGRGRRREPEVRGGAQPDVLPPARRDDVVAGGLAARAGRPRLERAQDREDRLELDRVRDRREAEPRPGRDAPVEAGQDLAAVQGPLLRPIELQDDRPRSFLLPLELVEPGRGRAYLDPVRGGAVQGLVAPPPLDAGRRADLLQPQVQLAGRRRGSNRARSQRRAKEEAPRRRPEGPGPGATPPPRRPDRLPPAWHRPAAHGRPVGSGSPCERAFVPASKASSAPRVPPESSC